MFPSFKEDQIFKLNQQQLVDQQIKDLLLGKTQNIFTKSNLLFSLKLEIFPYKGSIKQKQLDSFKKYNSQVNQIELSLDQKLDNSHSYYSHKQGTQSPIMLKRLQ